jgi:GntR family transcriptional regulator
VFAGDGPIFQQLAARIADDIIAGVYPEETAVPATASKGVNVLVDLGVLYKKRGVGMFVAAGAREVLRARRREGFRKEYVSPLVHEARVLEIDAAELHRMLDETLKDDSE